MLPRSIRWRIQVWHGFLLTCLVGALLVAFYNYVRGDRLREIDAQLQATLSPLLPTLVSPNGPETSGRRGPPPRLQDQYENYSHQRLQPGMRAAFDEIPEPIRTGRFYYISWSPEGRVLKSSGNAPSNAPFLSEADFRARKSLRTFGEFREAIHYLPAGGCIAVGTSVAELNRNLKRLAFVLTAAAVAIVAFGMAVGGWMAGRALRPIAEISATAEKIATGKLSERINVSETESELGKLAAVLNTTFQKLEESFEQQVRFTADASHELRTPVSVILTQIQLALSRERSAEDYRKTLETCERAAERMRTLVNQLLELTRHDTGEPTLVLERCDLSQVGREALDFIAPLAQKKQVKVNHSLEPIKVKADVMKLGQVLINLLNNAIQHNEDGIELSLSVCREGDKAVIRVADNGAGIPASALPHLFDRFYRVDKARSRSKGSSGLGLAISKAIVEGHGGTIRAQSEQGKGATFVVELPMSLAARMTSTGQSQFAGEKT